MPGYVVPPNVLEAEIEGYAYCSRGTNATGQPRCTGHAGERVPAKRTVVEWTYESRGGDIPGVENSQVHVSWADEDQQECPGFLINRDGKVTDVPCGKPRILSETERPVYDHLAGDVDLLDGLDVQERERSDQRVADLEAQLRQTQAELKSVIDALVPVEDDE